MMMMDRSFDDWLDNRELESLRPEDRPIPLAVPLKKKKKSDSRRRRVDVCQ